MPTEAGWDRSGEIESVRATYEQYDRTGRDRLWKRSAPGFQMLKLDLTESVVGALRHVIASSEATVVDLGCGTGELLDDVDRAGLAARWIGVDVRPDAIRAAREAYPSASFLVASADEVPLGDGEADVVIAQLLFSSLPSARFEEAVAREITRILRPGGHLVWLDIRMPSPRNPAVHAVPRRRISQLFPAWRSELRTTGLVPPLARRLGWLAGVAYRPLRGLPALRSHLVGTLVRPEST